MINKLAVSMNTSNGSQDLKNVSEGKGKYKNHRRPRPNDTTQGAIVASACS